MAESYIPHGVTVTCTFMTNSTPQKLGLDGSRCPTVINKAENKPLLNINDKKISDTFVCQAGKSFWTGLGTLLIGLAVGIILGAAIVATGGAAAVVILAVAGVAAAAGVGAVAYGFFGAGHDCDLTLESKWISPHDTVKFNKAEALLSRSLINCNNGGKVEIIMNPTIAQQVAEDISNSNYNKIAVHMGSQFVMGTISGVTALGDPVGAVLTVGLSADNYRRGEDQNPENDSPFTGFDEIKDTAIGLPHSIIESIGEVTKQNQAIGKAIQSGAGGTYLGWKNIFTNANFLKGQGAGIAGSIVNMGIDAGANSWEDSLLGESVAASAAANAKDTGNGLNVVANRMLKI